LTYTVSSGTLNSTIPYLYNKLYNKSTTNRQDYRQIYNKSTTSPRLVVQQIHNKSYKWNLGLKKIHEYTRAFAVGGQSPINEYRVQLNKM